MNSAAFIQSIMAKAKWGTSNVGGFTSASFLTMSNKLDNVVSRMHQMNSTYTVNGIPQPEFYEAEVKHALSARTVGEALSWGQKFVDEHYQYVTFPGIDVMGKVGGNYGYILKDYFTTKERYVKSYGDIGASIGGLAAGALAQQFLFGAIKRSVFSVGARMLGVSAGIEGAGLAYDATILGAPAGLVLNAIGGIVALGGVAVTALEGQRLGRAAGEAGAKMGGSDRLNAGKAAANDILGLVPKVTEMWSPIALSLHESGQYDGSPKDMFKVLDRISSKNYGGVSLKSMGLSRYEDVSENLSNVSKTMNVGSDMRGEYVNLIGKVKAMTGTDISGTLSQISSGITPTEGNVNGSIDFTAQIFNEFFLVATKGGVASNTTASLVAQSLTEIASAYAKKNINNKDVAQQVAGVQSFTQKYVQGKSQVSADSTGNFLGIMNKITDESYTSPLASNLMVDARISRGDALRGAPKPGQMGDLLNVMSNRWQLGGKTTIDATTGTVNWDKSKDSEVNFANFINAATGDVEKGGLGLSVDDAMMLGKYLIAYQNNPGAFESIQTQMTAAFKKSSNGALDKSLGSPSIAADALLVSAKSNIDLGNHYLRLAGKFTDTFIKIGNIQVGGQIALLMETVKGMDSLVKKIRELQTIDSGAAQSAYSESSGGFTSSEYTPMMSNGVVAGYGTFGTKLNMSSSGITNGLAKGLYDQAFLNKVESMAAGLGVDPNWIMAFIAHESWGTFQTGHIRGSSAVGLAQFTPIAITDLNNHFKGANLSKESLAKMSNTEQLTWVERYLHLQLNYQKKGSVITNAGDLYALVFTPAAFGKAAAEVMYSIGSDQYAANRGLDKDGDGTITVGEIRNGMMDDLGRAYMENVSYTRESTGGQVGFTSGPSMTSLGVKNSSYSKRIIVGIYDRSHVSDSPVLAQMKNANSKIGSNTASWAERALVDQSIAGEAHLKGMCATLVGWALTKGGGFKGRPSGSANEQLSSWLTGSRGAVAMSVDEVLQTGGFEPGDILYVKNGKYEGNHTGVVTFDGSVIQSGFAYDAQNGTYLLRSDLTSFMYNGVNNIVVIRPGMDANNDGFVTDAEHLANTRTTTVKPATMGNTGVIQGTKALLNRQNGNFTLKGKTGGMLTPLEIKKIQAKEKYIESTLGLSAENFSLTEDNGTLRVRINVGSHDPTQIANLLIKEIDSFI